MLAIVDERERDAREELRLRPREATLYKTLLDRPVAEKMLFGQGDWVGGALGELRESGLGACDGTRWFALAVHAL